jgi:hypothetical protein
LEFQALLLFLDLVQYYTPSLQNIYGLDRRISKSAVLTELIYMHPKEKICFIEDRLATLLKVRSNEDLSEVEASFYFAPNPAFFIKPMRQFRSKSRFNFSFCIHLFRHGTSPAFKLVTHSAKGITEKDFALAKKIEEVVMWDAAETSQGIFEGTPNDPRFKYIKKDN